MAHHYWVTALIVIPSVVITLTLSSLVAFGISRFSWRFNIVLLLLFTAGNLLPPQVLAQPLFQMYKRMALPGFLSPTGYMLGSNLGIITIHVAFQTGFCTFVLSNYMKTLPAEISEAAMIDGAGVLRQFWQVTIPLCKPALAALATLQFTWVFNDFFWAVLLQNQGARPADHLVARQPRGAVLHQRQPRRRRLRARRHPHPGRVPDPATPVRQRPDARREQRLSVGGPAGRLVDVASDSTSFVIDPAVAGGVVVHWGAAGRCARRRRPRRDRRATARPATIAALDVVAPIGIVAEHASGYPGHPGLSGHRGDGSAWAPRFTLEHVDERAGGVEITSVDAVARLRLVTSVALHPGGARRIELTLTNEGDDEYQLDALDVTLAVPDHATELETYHGRWCREFHPTRRPFGPGAFVAENRRGRTSHETPPVLWAGTAGFGEERGEVWGAHLAWSGNSRVNAERLPDGRAVLQLGELLLPGEVVLAPGESYRTPPVYAVHSPAGRNVASRQFHAVVPRAPAGGPRPVVLNTWEAVYFDHDFDTLVRLAERAAGIGVERFVLDDGWFGGRRDDRAGLGDWWCHRTPIPTVWRR